ncbi:hypothetical protein NC653_029577 [Populus alba x Populus x berolinensis]|uniref:Uncharacterized protein n=1 Tax=Populus alba x Populus x berolinensis TaxID=444605 RepID=A0AAD6M2G9_9ROSI|nr:hypothetical protein NC653_029577 [Populus alba x Populus x berolinensis]
MYFICDHEYISKYIFFYQRTGYFLLKKEEKVRTDDGRVRQWSKWPRGWPEPGQVWSSGKRQVIGKRLGAWGCGDADAAVTLIECKGIGALQLEIREKRKSLRNEFEMCSHEVAGSLIENEPNQIP